MRIRRGNISDLFLFIAVGMLFWVLPYKVEAIPDWIFYAVIGICILIIIEKILAHTSLWDKFFMKEPVQTLPSDSDSTPSTNTYSSIVRITAQEPSKHPPVIFDTVIIICSLIMLASGAWIMYLAILGEVIPREFDFRWLLFIILVIVLPIWMLVDTLIVERKQRKLGRSRVAKEKTIDLNDRSEVVFNRCLRVIVTEQYSIIVVNRPKLIKARWRKSIMTVTVTNMGHGRIRVNILSDNQWSTTKWDFGINQRNVDSFERLLQTEEM